MVGLTDAFSAELTTGANGLNCTTMPNKWTETSMIELNELNLRTVHVAGIPDQGLCQL